MKKIILMFLGALICFSMAYAKEESQSLILRSEPNEKASIVAKLEANQILVPIYQQGDWLKVGNPDNGQVGWVDSKTYQKMHTAPVIQSVMMTVSSKPDQKGSPQIVAYQNGRRLSDTEAKALLVQVQKEQKVWDEHFRALQASMEKMFEQSMNWFKHFEMPKLEWPFKQPSIVTEP